MTAQQRLQTHTERLGEARLVRDDAGREVAIFITLSGVTAIVSTAISDGALAKFERSLRRKLRRTELRVARRLLANAGE